MSELLSLLKLKFIDVSTQCGETTKKRRASKLVEIIQEDLKNLHAEKDHERIIILVADNDECRSVTISMSLHFKVALFTSHFFNDKEVWEEQIEGMKSGEKMIGVIPIPVLLERALPVTTNCIIYHMPENITLYNSLLEYIEKNATHETSVTTLYETDLNNSQLVMAFRDFILRKQTPPLWMIERVVKLWNLENEKNILELLHSDPGNFWNVYNYEAMKENFAKMRDSRYSNLFTHSLEKENINADPNNRKTPVKEKEPVQPTRKAVIGKKNGDISHLRVVPDYELDDEDDIVERAWSPINSEHEFDYEHYAGRGNSSSDLDDL